MNKAQRMQLASCIDIQPLSSRVQRDRRAGHRVRAKRETGVCVEQLDGTSQVVRIWDIHRKTVAASSGKPDAGVSQTKRASPQHAHRPVTDRAQRLDHRGGRTVAGLADDVDTTVGCVGHGSRPAQRLHVEWPSKSNACRSCVEEQELRVEEDVSVFGPRGEADARRRSVRRQPNGGSPSPPGAAEKEQVVVGKEAGRAAWRPGESERRSIRAQRQHAINSCRKLQVAPHMCAAERGCRHRAMRDADKNCHSEDTGQGSAPA